MPLHIVSMKTSNVLLFQVLSLLPPFKGKTVLELGAGIGRFTGELAKEADQVIALDFIESVVKKVNISLLVFKLSIIRSTAYGHV